MTNENVNSILNLAKGYKPNQKIDMEGITLVRKIGKLKGGKSIPILVLTTESQGSIIDEGKNSGFYRMDCKNFLKV